VATATRDASTSATRVYTGPFASLVNAAAHAFGLDPFLLAGVLKTESGFQAAPDHVDPNDAGIAGINLPSHPDVTRAQAQDPSYAIPWAARYLAELKQRYNGSTVAALRAYNTGSGDPSARGNSYATTVMAARSSLLGSVAQAVSDAIGALAYPLGVAGKVIGTPYSGTHRPGATTSPSWQSDNAVDIAVPAGTPIYALTAGTIGARIGPQSTSNPYAAGQRLYLNTGADSFFYDHLSRIVVKAGQTVKAGQLLGYSGSANGVDHLHLAAENSNPLQLVNTLDAHGVTAGAGAVSADGNAQLASWWKKITGAAGDAAGALTDPVGTATDALSNLPIVGGLFGAAKTVTDTAKVFGGIGEAGYKFAQDPAYPFLWLLFMLAGVGLVFVGLERLLGRSAGSDAKRAAAVAAAPVAAPVAAAEAAPVLVAP
jgi:murein DD-endopeptidase MepM/ murein hydrolase activator NlpD